jgi:integrase
MATYRTNDGLRKVCGCPRRGWPKCPHPWHFNYSWHGTPYRFSLDKQLGRKVRSKIEAAAEAKRLREAIEAGTFQAGASADVVCAPEELTLAAFADVWLAQCPKRRGKNRGAPRGSDDGGRLHRLVTLPSARRTSAGAAIAIGTMPIGTIVEADVEAALAALHQRSASNSTRNKYLQLFQSLAKWATKKGYLARSWFTVDSDVRRGDERGNRRDRRLAPDVFHETTGALVAAGEERRLLAVAGPRLQRLILGALETCCRCGELLQLQWRDVGEDWIQIRAAHAKDGEPREIPISTRLRAVLDMARVDPAGRPLGPDAYVFGNALGEYEPFPRKAWDTAVLRAHGHTPRWEPGKGRLTATSRAELTRVDLTFHDLRHEGGSRLLEAGWPLHHVRDMLGHADISTTSRYLNAERHGLRESMRRSDAARTFAEKFANNLQTGRRNPVENFSPERSENAAKARVN